MRSSPFSRISPSSASSTLTAFFFLAFLFWMSQGLPPVEGSSSKTRSKIVTNALLTFLHKLDVQHAHVQGSCALCPTFQLQSPSRHHDGLSQPQMLYDHMEFLVFPAEQSSPGVGLFAKLPQWTKEVTFEAGVNAHKARGVSTTYLLHSAFCLLAVRLSTKPGQ